MISDYELNIGDELVNFRFGVKCVSYLEKEWEADTQGVMASIGRKAMSYPDVLFYAAKNYCEVHKKDFKFTKDDAIRWYETDVDKCVNAILEGFQNYFPKNLKSPLETGNHIQLETAKQ